MRRFVRSAAALAMTETDTRAVLLMRSCERATLLGPDDAAWASREAWQQLGEAAPADAWLARRARLALGRLAERQPALRAPLARAQSPRSAAWVWLPLAVAVVAGVLGGGLGQSHQINLLALPLLGLVAWNLGVCLLVLVQGLGRRLRGNASAAAPAALPGADTLPGRLGGWLGRRWHGSEQLPAPAAAALAASTADWLALSRPLQAARGTALLHGCAALLGLGAVFALYARGLVFDYQAGWDSTFLQPDQVHALLQLLLGPAAWLAGLPLPDATSLAGLRLSAGGGESAAPWIHRWALTLLLVVVLPRGLLAGWSWRRARQLANALSLPDDADLQRLLQTGAAGPTGGRPVAVLPYSYRLDAAHQAAVAPALSDWLGPGLRCDLQPSLALGAEDQLPQWLPATLARLPVVPAATAPAGGRAAPPPLLVLLFALTATPERESHGAVVQALVQALGSLPAPRPQLRVAVDTSGYRQRLVGHDGNERLAQRRAAWEGLLLGLGVVPGFIDLAANGRP
jgi:hypothetical protein